MTALHTTITGPEDAPTIVLLHGLGLSGWMWSDQVDSLSRSYRCITIDLPGNGLSHGTEWTSFADSADAVAEVIRAEGGTAHVVGLSLGGYTALSLLERHPDVSGRVVVSGVSAQPMTPRRLWRLLIPVLSASVRSRIGVAAMSRIMQLPDEAVELYKRDATRLSRATVRRVYEEIIDFPPPALGENARRLLMAAGEKEARSIKTAMQTMPSTIPGVTTAIAPEAHHGWNGEFPTLFSSMVDTWISGSPLPADLDVGAPISGGAVKSN